MYYIYILISEKTRRYYIGCTKNLKKRLLKHNRGLNKSTKSGIPWKLIRVRKVIGRREAFDIEKKVKSYKGGNAFKKIVNGEVAAQ
jgi:putative endonuclease